MLKEIPCNVGAILYTNFAVTGWHMKKADRPYPVRVVFIGLNNSEEMGYGFINVEYGFGKMFQFNFSDIGKKIFLTKSQAREQLNELQ